MNGMKSNWYLGFLALIGLYKLPEVWAFFQGVASAWVLLNLLWFMWLGYFVPEKHTSEHEA